MNKRVEVLKALINGKTKLVVDLTPGDVTDVIHN